jgi:hypothetical protein
MKIRSLSIYLSVLIILPCITLADIKMKPLPVWNPGAPKVVDGSMDEWSPLGPPGGHGSVDNEWYFYDSGSDYWIAPQGGSGDPPLSIKVMVNHPVSGNPEPVACGLNLWGVYLCYEPHRNGVSVTAALDLPLSSNVNVSPDYEHPYNDIAPLHKVFYPVAFDADGNGDPTTVNSDDYYPAGSNGFNFVKPGGLVYDDRLEEEYRIRIYFGDESFSGGLDGLEVIIDLESEFGVIKTPQAAIPGSQTKSGVDLDLVATYGTDVLKVGGYDSPDPFGTPRIVDIEVQLNKLRTIIEDPTYIDWTKIPVGKLKPEDVRKVIINVRSGSLDDMSAEHVVSGEHVFPFVPIMKAN